MSATRSSAARIAANRQNALRSTGPRTAEGKLRSRANAVKHGLAGAGVALPTEVEAVVAERFLAIQEELAPQTMLGTLMAHQVALMSVRLQRAAQQEAAAIARHVRAAEGDFDEERELAVDALLSSLAADPARSRRRLLRLPEGVDRLVDRLLDLKADLAADLVAWGQLPDALLEAYFPRLGDAAEPRPTHLARIIRGEGPGLDRTARTAALAALTTRIDAEVRRLRAHRATLDVAAVALDRAGAGDRALFDPGREATLARKYEAAARREFFRALRDFRVVEAEADPIVSEVPPASWAPIPAIVAPAPTGQPVAALPTDAPRTDLKLKPGDTLLPPLGSFGRRASMIPDPPVLPIMIGRRQPITLASTAPQRPSRAVSEPSSGR